MKRNKLGSKAKHSYYLSTLSISLVLFLLSVVFYIGYIVESTTNEVVNKIQVSALLKDSAKKSSIDDFLKEVKAYEGIDSVKYISKEQAAEIYKKATGEDFMLFIDDNPLPSSVDIFFKSDNVIDAVSKEQIEELTVWLKKQDIVDEVLQPKGVVDEVLGHVYKIKFVLYSFLITLLFISVILINNAIKLTIRSKRFLIKSMKLFGATDSFIRRPFLLTSIKQGFNASIFALFFFFIAIIGLNRGFIDFSFTREELLTIGVIFVLVMVIGVAISLICTLVAVNKQIKQKNSELHTY
ncbi:MAG: permease-like cell division protein FtsX [Rikenellaceae bacterium]